MNQPVRGIGFVAYEGVNLLSVSGPLQVFATATEQLRANDIHGSAYRVAMFSGSGGSVWTSSGVPLSTEILPESGSAFDTIIIGGGEGAANVLSDARLAAWLRENARHWRRTASVCTGSLLLAQAGILDGRRAATHWDYCARLKASGRKLIVEPDAIFVNDGPIWTSAGVSAGMDMALAMVEADWGPRIALLVAKRLVLYLKRPGGQSQFSMPLPVQSTPGRIGQLLDWIAANPAADCRIEALADRAAMSERLLHRAFLHQTGQSPAEFVEHTRVENARRMLEESDLDIGDVALQCGFRSAEDLRRALTRAVKVSPLEYRARFHSASPEPEHNLVISRSRSGHGAPAY